MQDKAKDLCIYRINSALETLEVARECIVGKHYKDAINRSYYASFYAVKAVLAMEGTDFKRHKDVVAYFNKNYVATEIFDKMLGRKLANFQQTRESSDYDDFFLASKEEAEIQCKSAENIIDTVKKYLNDRYEIEKQRDADNQ